MNVSYNWLKELTATSLLPREVAERLTMVGLAVDAVHAAGDDYVLEIDLTSNRPDCLSHLGVGRELCVIEDKELKVPGTRPAKVGGSAETTPAVEIRDADLCPRYAARVVRGVRIAASPGWLAARLGAIGQRPVNNVADVTNYVMHELGQPLHAFDLAKLDGGRIVVRRAQAGESVRTLDGVERKLGEQMLVIADASRPVAVAGVMGGEDSEISTATRDVLIESAYFDPASVRRTSRELNLRTEASNRFERGVDYDGTLRALDRCAELVAEIAGGTVDAQSVDVYPSPLVPPRVSLRPRRVAQLTGLAEVAPADARRILSALGFDAAAGREDDGATTYVVPTWRVDVEREEDLIEEVARHIGYDKIEATLPGTRVAGEYQPSEFRRRAARQALAAQGFDEAINFSFVDAAHDNLFDTLPAPSSPDAAQEAVTVENPIVENMTSMRASLLPGLIEAVQRNFDHGTRDVALYETGRVFAAGETKPREREALALIATGGLLLAGRAGAQRALDFYDLKGALEAAAEAMRVPALMFEEARVRHLRRGQAARVLLGETPVGSIGQLGEDIAARHKFRQPVYVCEVDLSALDEYDRAAARYRPLDRFPAVQRDLSLVIDRKVPVAQIINALERIDAAHKRGVALVGVFEGGNLPPHQRSVTLRIEYRADDRTLLIDEVDQAQAQVLGEMNRQFGAALR